MKHRDMKAQKKRIMKLEEKWLRPLGLLWWGFTFEYDPNRDEYKKSDGTEVVMRTYADWRYLRATIEVNVKCVAEQTDKELEQMFVHELMHVFLQETRMHGDQSRHDHEEHCAEMLSWAFIWLQDSLEKGKGQ